MPPEITPSLLPALIGVIVGAIGAVVAGAFVYATKRRELTQNDRAQLWQEASSLRQALQQETRRRADREDALEARAAERDSRIEDLEARLAELERENLELHRLLTDHQITPPHPRLRPVPPRGA